MPPEIKPLKGKFSDFSGIVLKAAARGHIEAVHHYLSINPDWLNAEGPHGRTLLWEAAYKNRVVEEAKGEAQRFISVYNEYAKAPEVTRKRLFLETMEGVLGASQKVIMESGGAGGGTGVVPYLPLPEISKRQGGGQ